MILTMLSQQWMFKNAKYDIVHFDLTLLISPFMVLMMVQYNRNAMVSTSQ